MCVCGMESRIYIYAIQGKNYRLNFSFVLSSFGSFCYMKTPKAELKRMVALGDGRTRKNVASFSPLLLDLIIKYVNTKSFEKALAKIKSEIDAGYPCMIGALDMFLSAAF